MSVKVNNIDDIAFIFSFKEIAKRAKVWKETLECACNLFEHEFGCDNCPLVLYCSDTHQMMDDINDIVYDKNGHPYNNAKDINRRLYVAVSRAKEKVILRYG